MPFGSGLRSLNSQAQLRTPCCWAGCAEAGACAAAQPAGSRAFEHPVADPHARCRVAPLPAPPQRTSRLRPLSCSARRPKARITVNACALCSPTCRALPNTPPHPPRLLTWRPPGAGMPAWWPAPWSGAAGSSRQRPPASWCSRRAGGSRCPAAQPPPAAPPARLCWSSSQTLEWGCAPWRSQLAAAAAAPAVRRSAEGPARLATAAA